jgi:hypothetical protein
MISIGRNSMKCDNTLLNRIVNIIIASIMVSTVFIGAVYSFFENVDGYKPINLEPTSINLNFFEDNSMGFDYKSSSPQRILYLDKDLNNNKIAYKLSCGSKILSVKEPKIILDSGKEIPSDMGKFSSKCQIKNSLSLNNKMDFNGDLFDVQYDSTMNGVKETLIINSPLYNITDDIIIQSIIDVSNDLQMKKKEINNFEMTSSRDFNCEQLIFEDNGEEYFNIPSPILWDSPDRLSTNDGIILNRNSINQIDLTHRISFGMRIS